MIVLISNDDGISATGIQTLRRALEPVAEVYLVAPDRQQSATGHAITMHKPLYPKAIVYSQRSRGWRVNGTPADCVKLGVGALLPAPPDLILSGINHGSNLGRDVFYSGTVSAAVEGMLLGIPSVALSLDNGFEQAFDWAGRFVRWWITSPHFVPPPSGILYNVNFPDPRRGLPQAMRVVRLGQREYANEFQRGRDPRGREYYWISGQRLDDVQDLETDVGAHHAGYITVTPLTMHLTANDWMARIPSVSVPQHWEG